MFPSCEYLLKTMPYADNKYYMKERVYWNRAGERLGRRERGERAKRRTREREGGRQPVLPEAPGPDDVIGYRY